MRVAFGPQRPRLVNVRAVAALGAAQRAPDVDVPVNAEFAHAALQGAVVAIGPVEVGAHAAREAVPQLDPTLALPSAGDDVEEVRQWRAHQSPSHSDVCMTM